MKELVWAKMKGFSPWPGVISAPPPELRRAAKQKGSVKCIFFFGSNNYAWIEDVNIKPYIEFKEHLVKSSKTVAFKEAVKRIEEYISDPEKYKSNAEPPNAVEPRDTDADFNKLRKDDGDTANESVEIATTPASVKSSRKSLKKKADSTKAKASNLTKKSKDTDTNDASNSSQKRKRLPSETVDEDSGSTYTPKHNFAVAQLLNRPVLSTRPDPPQIDMHAVSQTLKMKNIVPSQLKFGFLGLGIMGGGIVKNLLNSGHKVVVWNRTRGKSRKFKDAGAEVAMTPSDVIDQTDITFSCVSDPLAAKEMVFGNCGVLSSDALGEGKGYIEMTGIDADTSQDIADAVSTKGGRYLEAQIQGSKKQAEEGTLIILAAGDRNLFDECQTCFEAMGKNSFYLGDVGNASKMYLVLQMISGVALAGLAEGMALADRAGLQQKDVLEVLEITNTSSPMLLEKGTAIINGDYSTHHPLVHMQKDLKLALTLSDTMEQPLPLTASTHEVYKHAKRNGYSEHDACAVYIRSRI